MKYVMKAYIDAIQWNGLNLEKVKEFVDDKLSYYISDSTFEDGIAPITNNIMLVYPGYKSRINLGDYIIKTDEDDIFLSSPEEFKKVCFKLSNHNKKADEIENIVFDGTNNEAIKKFIGKDNVVNIVISYRLGNKLEKPIIGIKSNNTILIVTKDDYIAKDMKGNICSYSPYEFIYIYIYI